MDLNCCFCISTHTFKLSSFNLQLVTHVLQYNPWSCVISFSTYLGKIHPQIDHYNWPFKSQPHKMVKHTQTFLGLLPKLDITAFDWGNLSLRRRHKLRYTVSAAEKPPPLGSLKIKMDQNELLLTLLFFTSEIIHIDSSFRRVFHFKRVEQL